MTNTKNAAPRPVKAHRVKPAEKPENRERRLRQAARREDKLYARRINGSLIRLKAKQEARTTVYRLVYGEANTGLGTNTPALDCRRLRPMTPVEFREAGYNLMSLLRAGKFTSQQIAAISSRFNSLAPRNAEASFDFGPELSTDFDPIAYRRVDTPLADWGDDEMTIGDMLDAGHTGRVLPDTATA